MWNRVRQFFLPANQLKLVHKLWTVRIAFIGAVLEGAYTASPAFQAYVPPQYFIGACILLPVAVVIARITNQSGVDF